MARKYGEYEPHFRDAMAYDSSGFTVWIDAGAWDSMNNDSHSYTTTWECRTCYAWTGDREGHCKWHDMLDAKLNEKET